MTSYFLCHIFLLLLAFSFTSLRIVSPLSLAHAHTNSLFLPNFFFLFIFLYSIFALAVFIFAHVPNLGGALCGDPTSYELRTLSKTHCFVCCLWLYFDSGTVHIILPRVQAPKWSVVRLTKPQLHLCSKYRRFIGTR